MFYRPDLVAARTFAIDVWCRWINIHGWELGGREEGSFVTVAVNVVVAASDGVVSVVYIGAVLQGGSVLFVSVSTTRLRKAVVFGE